MTTPVIGKSIPSSGRMIPGLPSGVHAQAYIGRIPLVWVSPIRLSRSARTALVLFGVWTTLGLLSTAQTAIFFAQSSQRLTWGAFVARMLDWYTCAIFTPVFFWLAERFPIDRRHWRTNILVHLAVTSVAVIIKYSFLSWLARQIRGAPRISLARMLEGNFIIESMIMWAVIAIIHGILYYRRWQEREQLAAELRARLTEAQLDVLKAQLRPHFLFNTLNSISTLVHTDPDSADRMVVQLADLLRASLETSGKHEIPLAEELALLERYLDIMRARHADRLTVTVRVSPRARRALVPHFILQPLVENAIEHGIARRAGAGHLAIGATDVGDALHIRVADDGCGVDGADSDRAMSDEGIGLGNTRLRLYQLYGDAQSLTIEHPADGGTVVTIAIPLREWKEVSLATPEAALMTS